MYLRRLGSARDGFRYVLRESRWQDACWTCRDLLDLGEDPRDFIHYPGGNGFYFSPEVEEALNVMGVVYSSDELEDVFLPFLEPTIRRMIQSFKRRCGGSKRWSLCSAGELLKLQEDLHSFDKRRLHYLRCGRVDIGDLEGRPWKFLNVLLGKSRDEIEHTLEAMERQLRPHEYRSYLFTALHLQRYFNSHLLRNQPAALDGEKIDELFEEELCKLNADKRFFQGADSALGDGLHPYLVKYVILYFDHDFDRRSRLAEEAARQSAWWRQFSGRSPSKTSMTTEEACRCLGICETDLEKMNRSDVMRHYRAQAKKAHPDTGGDHEEFIRMSEAYQSLLAGKPT